MKKLALALALIICLIPMIAFAKTSEEEALEKAYQHLLEQQGVAREALNPYQSGYDKNGKSWRFSFLLKEKQEETDNLYVVVFRDDGSLMEMITPRQLNPVERFNRDGFEARPYTTASLMAMKQKWGDQLEQLMAEVARKSSYPSQDQDYKLNLMRALTLDIRPADAGALSQDEARKKAEAAILTTAPWSDEKLAKYVPQAAFHYVSRELGKPVWHFIYDLDAAWLDQYAQVARLFGGQEKMPIYVSVRVDAFTEALMGEVDTVYAIKEGYANAPFSFVK